MQAHLAHAQVRRNVVVPDDLERAGLEPVVDGVEDEDPAGVLHVRQQVEALRAAVHERDRLGEAPALVERRDRAHAEALVGPEHVADAQHQRVHRSRDPRLVTCAVTTRSIFGPWRTRAT